MKNITGTRRIVISAVVLAVAGVVAVMMLASRPTSSAMSGMNHGSSDASTSSPAPTTSADPHGEMPGMDMSGTEHGAGDAPASSTPPTTSADPHGEMPGMDMGSGDTHGTTPGDSQGTTPGDTHGTTPGDSQGTTPGDTHGTDAGHGDTAEVVQDRPIVPVLSTFGGGTSAVLLAAGFLRRKDRIRNQAKTAARAARRSAK